jgi:hypothetical protein
MPRIAGDGLDATLANLLAGCITRVTADACSNFFRGGYAPDRQRPEGYIGGGAIVGV